MESFKKMIPQEATVLRDGGKVNINAEQCAIGDIVFVKFGDRVPADIRVLEAQGFKVIQSLKKIIHEVNCLKFRFKHSIFVCRLIDIVCIF